MIITVKAAKGNGWYDINGHQLEVVPVTPEMIREKGSDLNVGRDMRKYYLAIDSEFNRKLLDKLVDEGYLGQHSSFIRWAEHFIFKSKTALIHKSYMSKPLNDAHVLNFKGEELRCD